MRSKYDRMRLMRRQIGYEYEGRSQSYPRSEHPRYEYRDEDRQERSGIEPGRAYPNERGARMKMPGRGKSGVMSHQRPQEYGMPYEIAEEWIHGMVRSDGGRDPKWSCEEAEQLMEKCHIECPPVEFWVALNAVYSDYAKVARKFGITQDDFWAHMAEAFLCDEDAVEDKLMAYLEYVVE